MTDTVSRVPNQGWDPRILVCRCGPLEIGVRPGQGFDGQNPACVAQPSKMARVFPLVGAAIHDQSNPAIAHQCSPSQFVASHGTVRHHVQSQALQQATRKKLQPLTWTLHLRLSEYRGRYCPAAVRISRPWFAAIWPGQNPTNRRDSDAAPKTVATARR